MSQTFYFEKKFGTQLCEVEAIVDEKQPDIENDVSDWDNQGWLDILDVKVYDVNTGDDVTNSIIVTDKEIRREIELSRDVGLSEVDWYE